MSRRSCRSTPFDDVQRIVLRSTKWKMGRQLMLGFPKGSAPLTFINDLLAAKMPTPECQANPKVQVSLGFTRRGLERVNVPDALLANFALQSPAFWAGAPLRAASFLRMTGENAPQQWDQLFGYEAIDAVVSVHAAAATELQEALDTVTTSARNNGLRCGQLPKLAALPPPPRMVLSPQERETSSWVHFGYRDGLSRVVIRGVQTQGLRGESRPASVHEAGEFLLGHAQDSGANPWIAGPRARVWPAAFRTFFRNGSFGILQQIEQRVEEFDTFVGKAAEAGKLTAMVIKGKLCGRFPDGRPLGMPPTTDPEADFDYAGDQRGYGCPYGSHARRMSPRLALGVGSRPAAGKSADDEPESGAGQLALFSQRRPLLRRGLSYGTALWEDEALPDLTKATEAKKSPKGLVGQFFCASIEDQYEHLLGEWGDRVPMGSPDGGGARDPFMGAHASSDGPFEIPLPFGEPIHLHGLRPFVRTIGVAYLFYPSLTALTCIDHKRAGIAGQSFWDTDDLVNVR